jgi:protein transport protein SEC24
MCNLSNEIPQLFDWDQANNQPADRWQRAELNHSVVDFVAPTEYMVRPPQALAYVFLIDVSYAAVNCGRQRSLTWKREEIADRHLSACPGMVATAARTILESLDRIPNEDNRTKISLIAVDSNLHFFFMPVRAFDSHFRREC